MKRLIFALFFLLPMLSFGQSQNDALAFRKAVRTLEGSTVRWQQIQQPCPAPPHKSELVLVCSKNPTYTAWLIFVQTKEGNFEIKQLIRPLKTHRWHGGNYMPVIVYEFSDGSMIALED